MDLQRRPFEETIGERDLTSWDTPVGRVLARTVTTASSWTLATWFLVGTVIAGLGLAITLSAGAAETYEAVVEGDGVAGLDRPLLDAAITHRPVGVTRAVTAFTDIGGPVGMPILTLVLVLVAGLTWRSWAPLVLTLLAAAGSLAMTMVGKQLVGRVRPPLADAVPPYEYSPSFPSGHTLNTTVIIGILTYLLLTHLRSRRSRWWALVAATLWIALMGLSRVYLGHHWLTDVVCGWLLGLAWVMVLVTVHRLWLTLVRHHAHATHGGTLEGGRADGRPSVGTG